MLNSAIGGLVVAGGKYRSDWLSSINQPVHMDTLYLPIFVSSVFSPPSLLLISSQVRRRRPQGLRDCHFCGPYRCSQHDHVWHYARRFVLSGHCQCRLCRLFVQCQEPRQVRLQLMITITIRTLMMTPHCGWEITFGCRSCVCVCVCVLDMELLWVHVHVPIGFGVACRHDPRSGFHHDEKGKPQNGMTPDSFLLSTHPPPN